MSEDMITVEEMAALHGVAINTVQRILRADQQLPEDQRRIPGAFKLGGKHRGIWQIPRQSAEAWLRDARGRK